MLKLKSLLAAVAIAAAIAIPAAWAAGFFTNGVPVAGGSQYPTTFPLTGLETLPADTNLGQGLNPASEAITVSQMYQGGATNTVSTATSFAAGATETTDGAFTRLLLTGAPSSGVTLSLPTAANIVAQLQSLLPPALVVPQYSYLLKIVNVGGTSSGVWTVAATSGDTITGNATVAVAGSRLYLVTVTNVSSPAGTCQDYGN